MRVSFAAVSEVTPEFLSMVKILLFSFRKNAGIYKNSPFTIVTNGKSFEKFEISKLKERFAPLDIVTMPRLGGVKQNNKFNSFYAVDPESYDVLIVLDCDIAILSPIDEITTNINPDIAFMKSIRIGMGGSNAIKNYHELIVKYACITKNELESIKDSRFYPGYPLFNSGVIVISNKAVLAMREDVIKIAYDLYKNKTMQIIPKRLIKKFIYNAYHNIVKNGKTHDDLWVTEQIALALAMIKNRVSYDLLENRFNFTSFGTLKDGSLPSVFHYLKVKYQLGVTNLLEGDWFEEYLYSDKRSLSELAKLIKQYNGIHR